MYDCGGQFLDHEFNNNLIKFEYGILVKKEKVLNLQTHSIIKRISQVLHNLVQTFNLEKNK